MARGGRGGGRGGPPPRGGRGGPYGGGGGYGGRGGGYGAPPFAPRGGGSVAPHIFISINLSSTVIVVASGDAAEATLRIES